MYSRIGMYNYRAKENKQQLEIALSGQYLPYACQLRFIFLAGLGICSRTLVSKSLLTLQLYLLNCCIQLHILNIFRSDESEDQGSCKIPMQVHFISFESPSKTDCSFHFRSYWLQFLIRNLQNKAITIGSSRNILSNSGS